MAEGMSAPLHCTILSGGSVRGSDVTNSGASGPPRLRPRPRPRPRPGTCIPARNAKQGRHNGRHHVRQLSEATVGPFDLVTMTPVTS